MPSCRYINITLRNVTVMNPQRSAGVLIADASTPMENIVFDNVVVKNARKEDPWGDGYDCEHVNGVATGTTDPVPSCFKKIQRADAVAVTQI